MPRRSQNARPAGSSGSSKLKEKDLRREEISQDHASIQKAERFLLQIYYFVDKYTALLSLLDYEPALEKFEEYIAYEANNTATTVEFWQSLRTLETKQTEQELFRMGRNLCSFYLENNTGGASRRVVISNFAKQSIIQAMSKPDMTAKDLVDAYNKAMAELHTFMSNLYAKFLQSKYYTAWRCQERGHASGLALEYVLQFAESRRRPKTKAAPAPGVALSISASADNFGSTGGDYFGSSEASPPKGTSNKFDENTHSWSICPPQGTALPKSVDLANTAFHSLDVSTLSNLISSDSRWLIIMLAGMENIPLSFSLHSALKEDDKVQRVHFPYIYANRYHEIMGTVRRRVLRHQPMHYLFENCQEIEDLLEKPAPPPLPLRMLSREMSFTERASEVLGRVSAKGPSSAPTSPEPKQFSSLKGSQSRFFKPKPLPFAPSGAADVVAFYDNIAAGNPSLIFLRVVTQENKEILEAETRSSSCRNAAGDAPKSAKVDDWDPVEAKNIVLGVKPILNSKKDVLYYICLHYEVRVDDFEVSWFIFIVLLAHLDEMLSLV